MTRATGPPPTVVGTSSGGAPQPPSRGAQGPSGTSLADILERVLDKGIVIAGDIKVNLLDIELLTVKLRLLVASVDKAKEMGIDWWEHDPSLSSSANGSGDLAAENEELRRRIDELEGNRSEPAELPAEDTTSADTSSAADGAAAQDHAARDQAMDEAEQGQATQGQQTARDQPAPSTAERDRSAPDQAPRSRPESGEAPR